MAASIGIRVALILPRYTTSLCSNFTSDGQQAIFLLDLPIISLDTTQLKDDIFQSSNYKIPITDVLNLYFQTHCEGNYVSTRNISPQVKNVSCSAPSFNVKFLPANIIHFQLFNPNSSVQLQLPANNFAHQLGEIQNEFKKSYHAELHAALIIYATTICLEVIVVTLAFISFLGMEVVCILGIFSILTTIFLLIGNSITTTLQHQAVTTINQYGNDAGIAGHRGTGLLVLIWTAFGVSCVATGVRGWSALLRKSGEENNEGLDNGRVYIHCVGISENTDTDGPLRLAVRGGKV
ncbi:7da0d1ed-74d0-4f1a-af15-d0ca5bb6d362 [Sclerotinia trifoliorum]|uniref:7da0d1ed-74d0-4f1a-af15-d0ca5bb6d362 n=1 Tax=Sclerotinia trifoliorum TaxID=28548 RepID=A0A8H2VWZ2_9HELO|nr:7da0d1ed-74d0-4f1a-af15-d0ca5bb6d362 [Sclerotinia trifoliorum]